MRLLKHIAKRRRPERAPNPAEVLLAEFDALSEPRKDAAAGRLALLWQWFRDAFDGPAEFLALPAEEQDQYLHKIRAAAEFGAPHKNTDLGHYYFSSAFLSSYLEALRANDVSPAALAVSHRVVWMVERGRVISRPR